jgi:hypothetical protein
MGLEQAGDRGGAVDQGPGGPVDGKKDSDIFQHAAIAFWVMRT